MAWLNLFIYDRSSDVIKTERAVDVNHPFSLSDRWSILGKALAFETSRILDTKNRFNAKISSFNYL